jgi:hypothetical protein
MSEQLGNTLEPAPSVDESASVAEVESVIVELEQYRDRIYADTLAVAQRAKLPKKLVLAQLENNPDIVQIDSAISQLRAELGQEPSLSATE